VRELGAGRVAPWGPFTVVWEVPELPGTLTSIQYSSIRLMLGTSLVLQLPGSALPNGNDYSFRLSGTN
jgi:hypothetical protein